jgi:hypothetical protein
MPAGRPPLPTEKRRVQIGLLVSPEARARLRRLAEDRGISQNRPLNPRQWRTVAASALPGAPGGLPDPRATQANVTAGRIPVAGLHIK